ncbi:hypothetical protein H9L05_13175 [Hymenobacter qilianensis]|uniref:Amidohydrolase family protein n=1 Tax=Hymenobacter qilianensis TaxID=1385715 RepID=A0A7H0GRZ9_9BACT|nr:hypothetical protein [Hymenobacter qilianensis]QNP51065.1 hypothetical protein H9L05_13175 [Hymenobacter qilianensis]
MKISIRTAAVSLAFFLTQCAAVKSDKADLVITHVNVIDVITGTVQPDQNVVVSNGLIQRIESAEKAPSVLPNAWMAPANTLCLACGICTCIFGAATR